MMKLTTADDLPLAKIPTRTNVLSDVAAAHDVDQASLAETLEAIQDDLAEFAVDIHGRYTSEWGENAIVLDAVIWEALYVYQDEWNELRDRLDLDSDLYVAARDCHQREVDRMIETVDHAEEAEYLATNDYLIMPTPLVARLMGAGLSRRQALVQALRMDGHTQEEIGDRLGNATGTVKSHCDRIDRKIEQARKLLSLVEDRDRPTDGNE